MLNPVKTSEPIPGYIVGDRIGVGGYGEVWSAQAPGGLSKAIKFVYGYFDDERGARELKALNRIKQVRHPFLLSLERFEIIDGQLIIVTELADSSLKDRFEKVKESGAVGIPRDELLGYLHDAADALDYMRENFSLQHLDVKPENLLLVGGRVKVADFGLVKELHDVTASLMGGLTPVYAPPEVFDGQPSLHSDQYSLAIVFQEMLTGVLPFPGRTPAQLASQHLHAKPRLAPLPAADQPIVGRALSKDPDERFASCRALIDCLLAADKAAAAAPPAPDRRPPGGADSSNETTSIKSRLASTDTAWQRRGGPSPPISAPRSPITKTMVLGSESVEEALPAADVAPEPVPDRPAVDLAPIELTTTDLGLRPTLFLGIGGTASRTLRRLRRRLRDRLGPAANAPALQMLLLDTDARNIYQATQGDPETALADAETISLPLRNAHDYTTDSRNILQWLSRRWLYNIPRSLQTEGRRPLGRLALVDHAQPVLERLRAALAEITGAEAIAATTEATGLGFRTRMPRVFLISSISGGTGGGMVLDVAYAVRKILADLGFSDDGVCGILTHSTDRNPSASDLAIANAYACLSELQHYSGPSDYPGEPSCGLPPFEGDRGTFPNAYFVHLGDDLNDQDFEQATDTLASYMYLDTVTPAGAVLDECRKTASDAAGTSLRSFGLVAIGSAGTALPALATELLCKEVVDGWRGARVEAQELKAPSSLVDIATQHGNHSTPAGQIEIEARAAEQARGLGLELEPLCEKITALLENELGGDAQAVFAKLRASVDAPQAPAAPRPGGHAAQLLHATSSLFGPLADEDEGPNPASLALRVALEQDLRKLVAPTADTIRDWILEMIDKPETRVGGAVQARGWYAKHLRGLDSQATEAMRELATALQARVRAIIEAEHASAPRSRVFRARRAERQAADIDAAILQMVRLRFRETTLQAVCQAARLIGSQVGAAGDHLNDAQRELGRLSHEFTSASPWEPAEAGGVIDEVRKAATANLRVKLPELVRKVDERFQAQFLQSQGGLRHVCQKADAMRTVVPNALRALARLEIVNAMKEMSIADAVLGPEPTPEAQTQRLRACLDAVRPKLIGCGGAQHLLAILPASAAGSTLQEAIARQLDPPPTVVSDSDADLVFCYEVQDLSLPNVAARLIANRNDFVQIAARLHTRMDVAWSGLASAGSRVLAECAVK